MFLRSEFEETIASCREAREKGDDVLQAYVAEKAAKIQVVTEVCLKYSAGISLTIPSSMQDYAMIGMTDSADSAQTNWISYVGRDGNSKAPSRRFGFVIDRFTGSSRSSGSSATRPT